MFILSSPSGAGKTSIVKAVLSQDEKIHMSISVTTRPIRVNEKDGEDYYFIDTETFRHLKESDEFLENAQVFGNHYGTPKKFVYNHLENGNDVIFDIDWQGAQQISQMAAYGVVKIFVLPPSIKSLKERLVKRNTEDSSILETRMKQAHDQISHWAEYDYIVINDDFEQTVQNVLTIIHAERLRKRSCHGLSEFVSRLREEDYA